MCALPVAELAAKDSALFMWATFPQLPEALRLIRAWGFTYKSVAFVWLKKNRKADSWFYGLGFWTRANAEVCLLATKGHPKRQAADIHQFIISPIEAHSKKPDETRDKIVALMGDLPRVELFARQTSPGWDVWGNEVGDHKLSPAGQAHSLGLCKRPRPAGRRNENMPRQKDRKKLLPQRDRSFICGGKWGASDGSLYFAGTQAAGAGVDTAGSTVYNCLYSSDIGLPGTVRTAMGVRNLDTESDALTTNFAFCHLSAPPYRAI